MADEPYSDPNRRAFPRTAMRQPATLVHGDHSLAVQTVDLGQGGLSFVAPRPVAPGTRCTLSFEVPLADAPVGLAVALKVVYSSYLAAEQFKIGTVFTALDDAAAEVLARSAAARN